MRRLWIGAVILAVLLTISLVLTVGIDRFQEALSRDLNGAAEAAMAEDWDSADALLSQADGLWRKYRRLAAAFENHEPLNEMDQLFSELEVYRAARMATEYAAVCAGLARQAETIGEGHSLSWRGLL